MPTTPRHRDPTPAILVKHSYGWGSHSSGGRPMALPMILALCGFGLPKRAGLGTPMWRIVELQAK